MNQSAIGILLLILAGAMNGSITLPMKFTKKWAWENTWLAWTIFALCVFPPVLALLTGEWKGSGKKPLHAMFAGLAVLVLSIVVLSLATS